MEIKQLRFKIYSIINDFAYKMPQIFSSGHYNSGGKYLIML